ncbi:Hpt domain-containing protein [candidate division CSSED10-310 bacterium]|uniref:Hpt domain-containing protein n=1 Tax=candidate division CSSED10-310 bacterium TaxID=2855610 RepID=A0ABV6Z0P3_UNCC1
MKPTNSDKLNKIPVTIDRDFESIIDEYLQITLDNTRELRESLAKRDFEKIETIGHNWKGTGEAYGLKRITEVGAKIETLAKNNSEKGIEGLVDIIHDYINRLDITFEEFT